MRVFYLVIVVVLFGIVSVDSPKRLPPVSVPQLFLVAAHCSSVLAGRFV